jgi:SagB-type dehydrogenase family enzyme
MSHEIDLAKFFHNNTKRNIYYSADQPDFTKKPPQFKEYPDSPRILLPKEDLSLAMPLDESILRRRSCRDFAPRQIEIEKLSKILWFSYSITDRIIYEDFEIPVRPVPSGGALYPFELYLAIFNVEEVNKGVYHYCSVDHSLELLRSGDFRNKISQLFMGQRYIADSGLCVIISSVFERTTWKYGSRGYRYILFEAGHIAQNVCLVASSQNLGTLPLGGFYDNPLARFIGIDSESEPIQYGLAIGYELNVGVPARYTLLTKKTAE